MRIKLRLPIGMTALACACLGCGSVNDEQVDAVTAPAICGDTTDWQDVESYDGTLGPPIDFVQKHSPAVGRLVFTYTETDGTRKSSNCTGTMITPTYFLTNHHCTRDADQNPSYVVRMNYQLDPSGQRRTFTEYGATRIEWTPHFDYAILETDGPAGTDFGTASLAAFFEPNGEAITMIQHPAGTFKKVDGGTVINELDGRIRYNDIDMIGGSSGAGLLRNSNGALIAINTGGPSACDETHPNDGLFMDALVAVSPILQRLAMDAAKIVTILF